MADGISPKSYQHLTQLGLQRLIDASTGPEGPLGVTSYHLVPTNGYHNGQRLPHDVHEDLKAQDYERRDLEGVEYFLIPEVSTNLPGLLSHYAQRTGVAELRNPPSGGVNRVRETLVDYPHATVAPDAVAKYVEDNDAYEEARKKTTAEDEQLAFAVNKTPAREPAEGRLEAVEGADQPVVTDTTGRRRRGQNADESSTSSDTPSE